MASEQTIPATSKGNIIGAPLLTRRNDLGHAGKPLFLELDRQKQDHVARLFETGTKITVEGDKQEILPKRLVDLMIRECESTGAKDDLELVVRKNEKDLDQRIVGDIGRDLDQAVKRAVLKHPEFTDGLAIIRGSGFAFMEHEHGSARDLKKALKHTLEVVQNSGSNGHITSMSSILPKFMPIPFTGSKLNYGTWGRPSFVDENIAESEFCMDVSLVKVKAIENITVNDKKESGFWTTDITDAVQEKVAKHGLMDGYALVTSFHTTVGIVKMRPEDTGRLHDDLLSIAPDSTDQYYHNRIRRRGELKLRRDGDCLGDGNGQSHVMASLTGFYTLALVADGKLQLQDGERILHHDFDTLPPRERFSAVTLVEQ